MRKIKKRIYPHATYSPLQWSKPAASSCLYQQMGKIKKRIYPRDITINIGKGAPVPKHPYEGEWVGGAVRGAKLPGWGWARLALLCVSLEAPAIILPCLRILAVPTTASLSAEQHVCHQAALLSSCDCPALCFVTALPSAL